VKLTEFNALCDREWRQEFKGDVVALSLTDDSYRELDRDVIINGTQYPRPLFIDKSELPAIQAGGGIGIVMNPITRSVVKFTGGADRDTAEVYSVPESRTVTCS
jgi:hypothetical protein